MDNIIPGKLKSIIQEIRLIPDHQFGFKRLIKRQFLHVTLLLDKALDMPRSLKM